MNTRKTSRIFLATIAIAAFTFSLAVRAQAQTEKVLFNIQGGAYGAYPQSFARDAAGNIYGALVQGGNATCSIDCGVIFKLAPNASGQNVETILHTFTNGNDGAQPNSIVVDSSGNLFVSTWAGGVTTCHQGCGAIVELSPIHTGGWSTTVLYDFTGGPNGQKPVVTMMDPQGNLYGFEIGGSYDQIFQLSPSSSGTWTHKTIYKFLGGTDGGIGYPRFMDANGNIFGTAGEGGNTACLGGCGLIFELSPSSSGTWTKTTIYTFAGVPDAAFPTAIVPDGAGNIFGTTGYGGAGSNSLCQEVKGCGTLYELSPSSGGGYTETILHSFNYALDGNYPSSLIFDASNNLYTTLSGGGVGGRGLAEEFTLGSDGIWEYTILHAFSNNKGGGNPFELQLDTSGDVFGITTSGGSKNFGVVFDITP